MVLTYNLFVLKTNDKQFLYLSTGRRRVLPCGHCLMLGYNSLKKTLYLSFFINQSIKCITHLIEGSASQLSDKLRLKWSNKWRLYNVCTTTKIK